MQTPFNKIANVYDELFSNTAIGKMQRSIICKYLDYLLTDNQKLNILELNCGTGEDAIYFAEKGINVVATDLSDEMLKVTRDKVIKFGLSNYVTTQKLDLTNPFDFNFERKFDVVFSNFGGLNCVDTESLKKISIALEGLLKERGRIIFVLMPKFSIWDSFYFLIKLKFDKVFRRNSSKPLNVNLNGEILQTYYYSPKEITKIFSNNYKVQNIKPVGFFIPPSFTTKFFQKKKKTLQCLKMLESTITNFSFLANFSDHFLIDMELKK